MILHQLQKADARRRGQVFQGNVGADQTPLVEQVLDGPVSAALLVRAEEFGGWVAVQEERDRGDDVFEDGRVVEAVGR